MTLRVRLSRAGCFGDRLRTVMVCDSCAREVSRPTVKVMPEGWKEVPSSSTTESAKHYCPKCVKGGRVYGDT